MIHNSSMKLILFLLIIASFSVSAQLLVFGSSSVMQSLGNSQAKNSMEEQLKQTSLLAASEEEIKMNLRIMTVSEKSNEVHEDQKDKQNIEKSKDKQSKKEETVKKQQKSPQENDQKKKKQQSNERKKEEHKQKDQKSTQHQKESKTAESSESKHKDENKTEQKRQQTHSAPKQNKEKVKQQKKEKQTTSHKENNDKSQHKKEQKKEKQTASSKQNEQKNQQPKQQKKGKSTVSSTSSSTQNKQKDQKSEAKSKKQTAHKTDEKKAKENKETDNKSKTNFPSQESKSEKTEETSNQEDQQNQQDNKDQKKAPSAVFDCFIYEGEDHLVWLKLQAMSEFVDYFVILETDISNQGKTKPLKFKKNAFAPFMQKILYIPIRNIPHRKNPLSSQQLEDNQRFIEDSVKEVFTLMAEPEDIIILSRIGQILTQKAIQQFIEDQIDYACPETQIFSEHFNKQSVHDEGENKKLPNYSHQGIRILTFSRLRTSFSNSSYEAARSLWCKDKVKTILKQAGWHFVSDKDKTVMDKTKQIYSNSYLHEIKVEDLSQNSSPLPSALLRDIVKNKGKSKYSPFVSGMTVEKQQQKSVSLSPKIKKFQEVSYKVGTRLVINCFPYNGEQVIMSLKMKIVNSFVDYVILTQGFYSVTGVQKELVFNNSVFAEYAHKIIYVRLKNMPFRHPNITLQQRRKNQHFMKNAAYYILKLVAVNEDILIMDDVDEMISKETLMKYDPRVHDYAITELRLFYFYYNRRSSYHDQDRTDIPNYWYTGTKLTTFKYLKEKFKGDVIGLRRGIGCKFDVASRTVLPGNSQSCLGYLIQSAGWHFSYVLNKENLQKKMRSYGHSPSLDWKLTNQTKFKDGSAAPNAHGRHIEIFDPSLPHQLMVDVLQYGNKSIFAPYLSGIDFDSLHKKDHFELYQASQKQQYFAEKGTQQTAAIQVKKNQSQQIKVQQSANDKAKSSQSEANQESKIFQKLKEQIQIQKARLQSERLKAKEEAESRKQAENQNKKLLQQLKLKIQELKSIQELEKEREKQKEKDVSVSQVIPEKIKQVPSEPQAQGYSGTFLFISNVIVALIAVLLVNLCDKNNKNAERLASSTSLGRDEYIRSQKTNTLFSQQADNLKAVE